MIGPVNDIRATFYTRCGCMQQIYIPGDRPPSYYDLPLRDPAEVRIDDAPPTLKCYTRTFRLTDARRNSWGYIEATYREVIK